MTRLHTPPTCDRCAQPISNHEDNLCEKCHQELFDIHASQEQLRKFSADLGADVLHVAYAKHYGEVSPHQTLSVEAALRELSTFPCPAEQDDHMFIEVMRGGTLSSFHLYVLPLNGPLSLPIQSGDTVLSFHDHVCNRPGNDFWLKFDCFRHKDEFLKVIAIE